MKTIKQIAEEIGVSKTAVRKKMTDEIRNQFVQTIGNTVFISEQGETLIKSEFSQSFKNQVSANQTETVSVLVSMLQKELEIKNNQIEDLSTALVAAQQTAQAAQALHAGTIQNQITDGQEQTTKKKWFWQK